MVVPISTSLSVSATSVPVDRADSGPFAVQDDATLVRHFIAGDETAFVEIVTRYRPKLFTVAMGMLQNRADAEEVAQDALDVTSPKRAG